MKVSTRFARVVGIALLLLLLADIESARAQSSASPALLLPVTLASLGPTTSGGPYYKTLGVSGDWAGYMQGTLGCGHCGGTINTINLRNVVNGAKYSIRAALLTMARGGDATFGAEGVYFATPYLVWRQPGNKNSASSLSVFTKGDFDCSICYFNVQDGKGGAVASLQPLDADAAGNILPLALDATGSGRGLALLPGASASALYLFDLKGGAPKQVSLPNAPNLGDIHSAVFFGDSVAWIGRTPPSTWSIYRYSAGEERVQIIAPAPDGTHLEANNTHLFWGVVAEDTVTRLNIASGAVDKLKLQGSSGQFMVAGNKIAWAVFQGIGSPVMLHVDQIEPRQELLQAPVVSEAQPGNKTSASLAAFGSNKLLFMSTESGPESGPPLDQRFELAWLTTPDPAFANVWNKADSAVALGTASRSWLWGPSPRYVGYEAYAEGPDGRHLVYYYDKSRMEVNNPQANPNDPYYVTNGLLVVELISGKMQLGEMTSVKASAPATMPVAGDPRLYNPLTPDYATLAGVASLNGDNRAPNRIGQLVDDAIDVAGKVSKDTAHAALTSYAQYMDQTGHNIPQVFSTYLDKMPTAYGFDWTFVLGYPITEAYWTQMRVGGKDYPVLIQSFQRRVLTYVPDFAPTWQVQQGNVGQHYLQWRYKLNQ